MNEIMDALRLVLERIRVKSSTEISGLRLCSDLVLNE